MNKCGHMHTKIIECFQKAKAPGTFHILPLLGDLPQLHIQKSLPLADLNFTLPIKRSERRVSGYAHSYLNDLSVTLNAETQVFILFGHEPS